MDRRKGVMTRGQKMGNEVGRLAFPIGRLVGCMTCGIGLAIDAVGERWGEEPYDWGLRREGHDKICTISAGGLPAAKEVEVRKLVDRFYGTLPVVATADPRLPPERDDEEEAIH